MSHRVIFMILWFQQRIEGGMPGWPVGRCSVYLCMSVLTYLTEKIEGRLGLRRQHRAPRPSWMTGRNSPAFPSLTHRLHCLAPNVTRSWPAHQSPPWPRLAPRPRSWRRPSTTCAQPQSAAGFHTGDPKRAGDGMEMEMVGDGDG